MSIAITQLPTACLRALDAEQDSGMCDPCPAGELGPAEDLQAGDYTGDRFADGTASPAEVLAIVVLIALASCSALHLALSLTAP